MPATMEAALAHFEIGRTASVPAGLSAGSGHRKSPRLLIAILASLVAHLAAGPFLETAIPSGGNLEQRQRSRPAPLRLVLPQDHSRPTKQPAVTAPPPAGTLATVFSRVPGNKAEEPPGQTIGGNVPSSDDTPSPNADSASTYFDAAQLSRRAQVVRDIPQDRPVWSRLAGQGKVILVLFINEAGRVDRVDVESSELPETLAEEAAQEFNEVIFLPAQIDGNAVKSRMRIEVMIKPL